MTISYQFINSQLQQQPEQIHLSYGSKPSQMIVTWATINETSTSLVEYGIQGLDQQASGIQYPFVDGGPEKRRIFIHKVTLKDLKPGVKYLYHCGGTDGWSSVYYFTAMKSGTNWNPR